MTPEYVAENRESRAELSQVAERALQLGSSAAPDCARTVSGLLCHLAFWDRWALHIADSTDCPDLGAFKLSPETIDAINDAAREISRGVPVGLAAQMAVESAVAIDGRLERLSETAASRLALAGLERVLKRSLHRREHLPQLKFTLMPTATA